MLLNLQFNLLVLNDAFPPLADGFPLERQFHHLAGVENTEPDHMIQMKTSAIDVPSVLHGTRDEASLRYNMLEVSPGKIGTERKNR